MPRLLTCLAAIILALLMLPTAGWTDSTGTAGEQALVFLQQLRDGKFTEAVSTFDSTMASQLSAAQLERLWISIPQQVGELRNIGTPHTIDQPPYTLVTTRLDFELTSLNAQMTYRANGEVAGLFFVAAEDKSESVDPAYVDRSLFTESEITFGEAEWELPGTLSLPNTPGPLPTVILVHGSGPNDRDETIGPNKPFRDIACGLASRGIAALRYDKRTRVYGEKFILNPGYTVREEVMEDVLAAVDYLKEHGQVDPGRIYMLGHSLGAMLAPRIAAECPDLAGIVVVAGAARPLEDLILEQMTYIDSLSVAEGQPSQLDLADLQVRVARVRALSLDQHPPATDLPLDIPAPYWLDLRYYAPVDVAAQLELPMLIIQGARDYQVTIEDFGIWASTLEGRDNATLTLYPTLNHLMISGSGKSKPSEYTTPGHVDKQVIEDIAGWIQAH
ncbi:MAG: alpha/beta fold hydrolase [candidate division Zixibacteria bacterium]|nr:alpha/beta fold hydrolase [candidate division Zixibacteria bacterium]